MSRGKFKRFLAGILCAAMLVGNNGSITAFAAPAQVPEDVQETMPAEVTSEEGTSEEATPAEAIPAETTPVETTPVETTPAETTPVETIPGEATPAEAAPMEASQGGEQTGEADETESSVTVSTLQQAALDANYCWNNLSVQTGNRQVLFDYNTVGYPGYGYAEIFYTTDVNVDLCEDKAQLTSDEYSSLCSNCSKENLTTDFDYSENGSYKTTSSLANIQPNTTYYYRVVRQVYGKYLFLTQKGSFTTKDDPEASQLTITDFQAKENGFAAAEVSFKVNNPELESCDSVYLVDENSEQIGYTDWQQIKAAEDTFTGTVEFKKADPVKVRVCAEVWEKGKSERTKIYSDELTLIPRDASTFAVDVRQKITGTSVAFSFVQKEYSDVDSGRININLTYQKIDNTSESTSNTPMVKTGYIYDGVCSLQITGLEENAEYSWSLQYVTGENRVLKEVQGQSFTTKEVVTYADADFPDAVLLAAIRQKLGNKELTNVNLAAITELYLNYNSGEAIKNLEGLQHLTGLTTLNITGHDISTANQVSALTELKSLYLQGNDLKTMPDLSGNTALTSISLDNNLLPPEEISADKLPSLFLEKNPSWISRTRDSQRQPFAALTAEEYYATGETWPFIAKFSGLKKAQNYTLKVEIDGQSYTATQYLYSGSDQPIIVKGMQLDVTGGAQKSVTYSLTGEDGVTYHTDAITCRFVEDTGGGEKQYLKEADSSVYANVHLNSTKTAILGTVTRLELETQDGKTVGVSAGSVNSYSRNYDDRYQKVFGSSSLDTGYAATQYSATIRFANHLQAGSYHVRIVGDGGSELIRDVVQVSESSVISRVERYSTIDTEGKYVYIQITGKSLTPEKVQIRLTNKRGEDVADFVQALWVEDDSMVYKYEKKDEVWNGEDEILWKLESEDCLDSSTSHNIYFGASSHLLLVHYNYKREAVEAKLSSAVAEGTEVKLTFSDRDLSYNKDQATIYGSGSGQVKGHWLQVKCLDGEGNVYKPSRNQRVYIQMEYNGKKENTSGYIEWYNYSGSGNVQGESIYAYPIRTTDTSFSVTGITKKLESGASASLELVGSGGTQDTLKSWPAAIGKNGSISVKCNCPDLALNEGLYTLRLVSEEAVLSKAQLLVYDNDKFYIDNQWGTYEKAKNSITASFSSQQIYGEQNRETDKTNFKNIKDYTVEVYDRIGNRIENVNLAKVTQSTSSPNVTLQLTLPKDLQQNYTGFYVNIRWKGLEGYQTSNPSKLYYESDSWNCDPQYGEWVSAREGVRYYFEADDTTAHGYYGLYCTDAASANKTDAPLSIKVYEAQTETLVKTIPVKLNSNGWYKFTKTNLLGLDEKTVYNLSLETKDGIRVESATGYIVLETSSVTVGFTVNFDVQGHGTAPTEITGVQSGAKVKEPAKPAEPGFVFGGWYKDAACNEKWDFATDTVTADMVLYAGWERDPKYCFVTFDVQAADSEAPKMQAVLVGKMVTEPEVPVRKGFVFTGWYREQECETLWKFAADKVTVEVAGEDKSMTLYAGWKEIPHMGRAATPTASILNGTDEEVEVGMKIFLTTATNGAKIYYTTDGSQPTEEALLYTDAIVVSEEASGTELKIRAIAVKENYDNSEEMVVTYSVKSESTNWGDVKEADRSECGYTSPDQIPEGLWVAGIPEETPYTGKKLIFDGIRVYDHKELLIEKTDYTVSYKNNQNVAWETEYDFIEDEETGEEVKVPIGKIPAAKASITIKGKGSYSGSIVKYFKITPISIDDEAFTVDGLILAYNKDKVQKAAPVLRWNGTVLKKNAAYTVSYDAEAFDEETPYKSVGEWNITIKGKGNFTGEMSVTETITEIPLMSKVTVGKIPNQPYNMGNPVEPELALTYKGEPLEDGNYTLEYENNTDVGTAKVTITGDGTNYIGKVTKTFKITGNKLDGNKLKKFTKSMEYTGRELTQDTAEFDYGTVEEPEVLRGISLNDYNEQIADTGSCRDCDYTIEYRNNIECGTATVIYRGVNGYTGTVKKTYKITAYDWTNDANGEQRINVKLAENVPYAKGGAKPMPEVTYSYGGDDGISKKLELGRDYTVSYENNTAVKTKVAGGSKNPVVIIKGKGSFKGKINVEFSITKQNLTNLAGLKVTAPDVKYQNKANIYKSATTVTDLNGKKLKAGTDYTVSYTYEEHVFVSLVGNKTGMTLRSQGEEVNPENKDIIPVGAVLRATITGKGNYEGEAYTTFRFTEGNLSGAKISVQNQYYTGKAVEPGKSQMTVKLGKTVLTDEDYEITGYTANVKKGTAKVTLRGIGKYGGTKTATFKILDRTMGYTIVFDGNGNTGGSMARQVIPSSAGKKLSANKFKKTGYRLAGWSTDPEGSEEIYADKEMFPGTKGSYLCGTTVILYAQWEAVTYSITYKLNGGRMDSKAENPELYSYTIETGFDLDSVEPERDGYTFVGWYTDKDLKKPVKPDQIEQGKTTGNKTFYAKWVKEAYE